MIMKYRMDRYANVIIDATSLQKNEEAMTIPDTNITLEELLDQIPMEVQYVDKDGFLRYLNKAAAARPANGKREAGVNIKDCHAKPESLKMIERIFDDFKKGRKEPHF
jgi:DUF438 domain-containing protein